MQQMHGGDRHWELASADGGDFVVHPDVFLSKFMAATHFNDMRLMTTFEPEDNGYHDAWYFSL